MKRENKHKILAVLLTVFMLIGQSFIAPAVTADESDWEPGEVRTYKTATPVEGKVNTWDITLRVEGMDEVDKPETTRVVLVIDRSGSMKGDRMSLAISAAQSFVDEVLKDPNLQVAVVSFSSDYEGNQQQGYPPSELVTTNHVFSSNAQSLKNAIGSLKASGGTHTQAGILRGKELLDALDSTIDNKIMVLLSDGLPTFSYEPTNWTKVSSTGGNSKNNRDQWTGIYDGLFNSSKVVGTGNSLTQSYNEEIEGRYITKHINNGSAAIKAASDTKTSIGQSNLFTIAVGTDQEGTNILAQIASPNRAYSTNDPDRLEEIYGEIANIVGSRSAVRSALVVDQMGDGFSLVDGSTIEKNKGTTTVIPHSDEANQTIEWRFPELTELVDGSTNIRFAEMTYQIEINDSILNTEPAEQATDPNHHLYWTNKSAVMTYTDIDDDSNASASFSSPKVDPVLLKIKKILTDSTGNLIPDDLIADDLRFNVEIKKSSSGDSANFPHTEALVPNAEDPEYVWLTTLRHEGTYSVEEIGVSSGSLSEYEIFYETDGVSGGTSFVVNHVSGIPRGDVEVKVTNKRNVAVVTIGGTKTLAGRTDASKEDTFKFELSGPLGHLPTKKVDELTFNGNGTEPFSFGEILFTRFDLAGADEKEFSYTVTEDSSQPIVGITYDENLSRTVIVTLSKDDQGRISATVDPSAVHFVNVYSAQGEFKPIVTKDLDGRDLQDNDFTFLWEELDAGSDPETWTLIEEKTNLAGGSIPFKKLTYSTADIGEHVYRITESETVPGGVTRDPLEVIYRVTVADNGDGTLSVTYDEPDDTEFNNSYKATGSWEPEVTKFLENRTLKADEFEFKLEKLTGTDPETWAQVGNLVKNQAGGAIPFGAVGFTQADIGKTYHYRISEVVPSPGETGMTYDTTFKLYTVAITDEGGGVLGVAVTSPDGQTSAFTNSYKATGNWEPEVTKILAGRLLKIGEFSFELSDGNLTAPLTASNDADGKVVFDEIEYDETDIGQTYSYTIKEVIPVPAETGMDYDTMVVIVTVTVEDAGNGKLIVTTTYPEDTTFNNKYEARNSLVLEASKVLAGRDLKADEFSFVLKDEAGEVLQTKKNEVDGSIAFDPIHYTEKDHGKVYTYTIEEVDGGLSWLTYDTHVLKVQVAVTDLGNGVLGLDVTYVGDRVFTNSYNPVGVYTPVATKVADGFTLQDDQFEFELVDAEGNVLQKVKNKANGGVQFAPLTFGRDDVGKTFVYTIREIEGTLEKIIYDDTEYTLTLTVTDEGDGTLLARRKAGEDPAIFTNLEEIVKGDEDEPATGARITMYTYFGVLMILFSLAALLLALKPRKKDKKA